MERHPIDANGAPTNGDVKRNMWAADAELPPRTGIFARDMGDLIGPNDDSLQPVGVYDAAAKGVIARNRVVGPGLKENFCLPEAELKPFVLFGEQTIPDGEGATATRSTFRIVRAIGEALFGGYLDGISSSEKNGLRFAFWARRPNAGATQDELGGFLAFLRYAAPGAGRRLLDSFGLMTEVRWEQIKGNKVDTTGLNRIRDHAHLAPATRLGFQAGERKFRGAWGIDEEKHFRAWHWAYRFQAMARTDPSFRLAVWDMIRMRLRELLYLSWPASDGFVYAAGTDATVPLKAGHIFTSELSRALVLAHHLQSPAEVVANKKPAEWLEDALGTVKAEREQAGNPLPANVKLWDDGIEEALIAALINAAESSVKPLLESVRDWSYTSGDDVNRFGLRVTDVDPRLTSLELNRDRRDDPFSDMGEDFTALPPPVLSPALGVRTSALRLRLPGAGDMSGLAVVLDFDGAESTVGAAAIRSGMVRGIAIGGLDNDGNETNVFLPFDRPQPVKGLVYAEEPTDTMRMHRADDSVEDIAVASAFIQVDEPIKIEAGFDLEVLFSGEEVLSAGASISLELKRSAGDATRIDLKVGLSADLAAFFLKQPIRAGIVVEDWPFTIHRDSKGGFWFEIPIADSDLQLGGLPVTLSNVSARMRVGFMRMRLYRKRRCGGR